MIWRILAILLLLISACSFPYIITILLGVLFLVVFNTFYEIIPIFFINDMLYGVSQVHFFGFKYCMTLLSVALVLLSMFFKKYIFEGSFIRS